MASEERLQKFLTDDVHYPDLDSASDWSMLQGKVAIIKVANFCQEVLNPLGSYSWVFTLFKPLFTARRKHYSTNVCKYKRVIILTLFCLKLCLQVCATKNLKKMCSFCHRKTKLSPGICGYTGFSCC